MLKRTSSKVSYFMEKRVVQSLYVLYLIGYKNIYNLKVTGESSNSPGHLSAWAHILISNNLFPGFQGYLREWRLWWTQGTDGFRFSSFRNFCVTDENIFQRAKRYFFFEQKRHSLWLIDYHHRLIVHCNYVTRKLSSSPTMCYLSPSMISWFVP